MLRAVGGLALGTSHSAAPLAPAGSADFEPRDALEARPITPDDAVGGIGAPKRADRARATPRASSAATIAARRRSVRASRFSRDPAILCPVRAEMISTGPSPAAAAILSRLPRTAPGRSPLIEIERQPEATARRESRGGGAGRRRCCGGAGAWLAPILVRPRGVPNREGPAVQPSTPLPARRGWIHHLCAGRRCLGPSFATEPTRRSVAFLERGTDAELKRFLALGARH